MGIKNGAAIAPEGAMFDDCLIGVQLPLRWIVGFILAEISPAKPFKFLGKSWLNHPSPLNPQYQDEEEDAHHSPPSSYASSGYLSWFGSDSMEAEGEVRCAHAKRTSWSRPHSGDDG